jgi:hypothetical protein
MEGGLTVSEQTTTKGNAVFTVTIETGNAVFEDYPGEELARILRGLADHVEGQQAERAPGAKRVGPLRDVNGNTVGQWRWER